MWRVYHFECYQCQSPYTRTAKKHKINKQTAALSTGRGWILGNESRRLVDED